MDTLKFRDLVVPWRALPTLSRIDAGNFGPAWLERLILNVRNADQNSKDFLADPSMPLRILRVFMKLLFDVAEKKF